MACHLFSVILLQLLKISIFDTSLKNTNLWLQPHLPGTNELIIIKER